jgi:hypothetical protein
MLGGNIQATYCITHILGATTHHNVVSEANQVNAKFWPFDHYYLLKIFQYIYF